MEMFECRICSNTEGNVRYSAREMMLGTREIFDYIECGECGCLQIEKYPSDVQKYYPDDYYAYRGPSSEIDSLKKKLLFLRDRHELGFKNAAGMLLSIIRPNSDLRNLSRHGLSAETKILDVGCGSGSYLIKLHGLGLANLSGIDPFCDPLNINGISLSKIDLSEASGTFDLIMLNHSFEHMPDPLRQLSCLEKLLSDGGICMIRIPISSSYAWRHYGVDWVQLDAPRHFYLHTPESVGILAAKSGLEVFDIRYDSTYFQFTGSEMYARNVSLKEAENMPSEEFSRLVVRQYQRKAEKLNARGLGDQAAFYLRRQ